VRHPEIFADVQVAQVVWQRVQVPLKRISMYPGAQRQLFPDKKRAVVLWQERHVTGLTLHVRHLAEHIVHTLTPVST